MKNFTLSILFGLLSLTSFSQTSYSWTGSTDTDWGTSSNWSPSGVPSTGDAISIASTTNQPVLDMARSIGSLTMSASSTLDLGAYTLTVSGAGSFTSATVTNGELITGSFNASSSTFSTDVNASGNSITTTSCTYQGKVSLEYTGTVNISSGGNTFEGVTHITQSGSGGFIFGTANPDVFEDSLFAVSNGANQLVFGTSSTGNRFEGYTLFQRGASATSSGIKVGNAASTTSLLNHVKLSSSSSAVGTFSTSVIEFRDCLFDSTASIGIDTSGFSLGQIKFLNSTVAVPTHLSLSGNSSFLLDNETVFEDSLSLSASNFFIHACEFQGFSQLEKAGSGINQSMGPITASGALHFKNSGSGFFYIDDGSGDYQDVTLENTSSGHLAFCRGGTGNTMNGNLETIISNGIISIGIEGANRLNLTGDISINSTGGNLYFGGINHQSGGSLSYTNLSGGIAFTHYNPLGTLNLDLTSTGSGNRLTLGAGSSFLGKFKAEFPSIMIQGGTYADSLTLIKTGNITDQGSGNLTCYGPVSFKSTHSSGTWQINYAGAACVYHDNVTYERNGAGNLDFGYVGPHQFKKNLHITGTHAFGQTNNHFTFNGTGNQTISRGHSLSTTFVRLAVDKPSGDLIVDLPLSLSVNLNLQKGIIKTTSGNSFTASLSTSITGGSDSSYVEGPMLRYGTSAFTYPIGGGGVYAPITLDAVASNCTFKVQYIAEDPDSLYSRTAKDTSIGFINRCGYWQVDRTFGTQNTTPTLGWDNNPCYSTSPVDASVAQWDGITWKDKGNTAYSGTSTAGNVKSTAVITSYPTILNLGGVCHFYSVGYIESLPDTLGDTLSIKVFPSSLKNYLFELNDSTLQDSSIDSLVFTNYQWNDTISITATDYNNCKANSEVKVIKKRESTCGQDDGISFSSGQTYTLNSKTCSCNTSNNPSTITSNIETSHDWQRIQGYDMRTPSLGGTNYNTPWKTIDFNIIVINDEDEDPTTGNFNEYHDLFFADALLIAQEQFSGGTDQQQLINGDHPDGMIPPSDEILEPEEESSGAKLIFNLNKVIHIEDNNLFGMIGVDLADVTSQLQAEDCNYQKRINIIVTEQRNTNIPIFAEAWGYASDPNCGSNGALRIVTTGSIQYTFTAENIFVPLATILNDNPDATVLEIQNLVRSANVYQAHRLGGHWAHEIGHNLDLYHTYGGDNSGLVPPSGFSPETNVISNFDFLDDVFDLNDENENSSFCNPPAGLICYHQPTAICEDWDNAYENNNEEDCHIYATNNIMGNFNIRFGYISPLQVAKVQRALSLKSVRKYVVGSPYDPNPIEITKNETWNMDIQLYNDIVVKSGFKLVIQCQVALPDQARIVVEPGAVLYLDGGTLTGFHEMWQGVRLLGDASASQGTIPLNDNLPVPDDDGYPDITSSQGVVIINQGTIENAEEGIFVGAGFNGLEYDKTGGVVHAYKAIFRNNFRDVAFNPYKFASKSKFIECEFITDDHLKNPTYYDVSTNTWAGTQGHVSLWDIDVVQFVDNTFINDQDYVIQGECPSDQTTKTFGRQAKGEGIGSYDARFYVFSTDPNNPTTPKRNEFTGLTIGINSRHTFPNSAIHLRVNGAYFDNNQYGIVSETGRNAIVSNSTFKIPEGTGNGLGLPEDQFGFNSNYEPFGVFAYDYRGHTINNNKFESTDISGTIDNYGLLFLGNENINTTARIVNNEFTDIENGLHFYIDAPAIFTNCNEFTDISKEFNIFPDNETVIDNQYNPLNTIKYTFQDQGTGCLTGQERVGNIFNDAGTHIWSSASDTWTYFHRDGQTLESPIFANENNIDEFNGGKQPCQNQDPPCITGGGGDPTISEIHLKRKLLKVEYDAVSTTINNWVVDDGNTSARLAEVADTTISKDTLVSKLRLHSPLSDTVLIQAFTSSRDYSSAQLFDIAEKNLPSSAIVQDSLFSRLDSDRKYDGIVDTLKGLQVYNPNFTTLTGQKREKEALNSKWLIEIATAGEYYAENDSLEALIPLYRDTLAGLGFERELIESAVGLDSIDLAKQVLDSLNLASQDDSLFADYAYLYFDMLEDTITWLQIDSTQLALVEKISRIPSSVQSYALAARALRGDTIYHRYPYMEAPSGARIGSTNQKVDTRKPQKNKSFELFPNPNNGEFTLQLNGYEDGTYAIDVLDLTGRIIQSSTSTVKDNSCIRRIQLRDVSYGMYFCRVSSVNSSSVSVKRIIITK